MGAWLAAKGPLCHPRRRRLRAGVVPGHPRSRNGTSRSGAADGVGGPDVTIDQTDRRVDDLVRRLAGAAGDPSGVEVVRGRGMSDRGDVHGWLALPPRAPRVLVSADASGPAARGLLAHPGLRHRGDRFRRRCLAVLVGSGVPRRLWHSARVGSRDADDAHHLVEVLREGWDPRVASLLLTIRPTTPNHKPTFLAVDVRGRPMGYGKLSTDASAHGRAQREVDGLRAMSGADVPGLRAPELLADLTWSGGRVTVAAPLPDDSRRYPSDTSAPLHLLSHAREQGRTTTVDEVAERLLGRIERSGQTWLLDGARAHVSALVGYAAGLPLQSGLLHGDWVPWNLAVARDLVWAFDWEHSDTESAVALDVVHWHVLVRRDRVGMSLGLAVKFGEAAATSELRRSGLGREALRAVLHLGRLRLVARTAELRASSGLWPSTERGQLLGLLDVPSRAA